MLTILDSRTNLPLSEEEGALDWAYAGPDGQLRCPDCNADRFDDEALAPHVLKGHEVCTDCTVLLVDDPSGHPYEIVLRDWAIVFDGTVQQVLHTEYLDAVRRSRTFGPKAEVCAVSDGKAFHPSNGRVFAV